MLWYKAWVETRFRFLLGVGALTLLCAFFVVGHPFIVGQWAADRLAHPEWTEPPWLPRAMVDYPFFVWHFLHGSLYQQVWALFALLLALGGIAREAEQGTAAFTLGLPVTRRRAEHVRAAVGGLEAAALGLLPALVVPLLSMMLGKPYPVGHGLVHGALLVAGGLVFYAFGVWLAAAVRGEYTPVLVGLCAIALVYFVVQPYADDYAVAPLAVQLVNAPAVMAGPADLDAGLPWAGLVLSLAVAAAFLFAAFRRTERQDF